MNYEQKYKEAMERAIDKFGGDSFTVQAIFPELRESEDERIRQWIKHYIEVRLPDAGDEFEPQYRDALAWLEKQKEQKPILSDRDLTDFEIEVHEIIAQARNDSRLNDADVLKQFEEEAAFALMLKANKLIEQKPAEWSEEDNIGWDEAFACVTRAEKAAKNEEELQNAVTAEKWLKEIKFKYCVHPVKPEWSEEDEDNIKTLIQVVRGQLGLSECRQEYIVNWLKSLRPQSHWKPSEEQMEALLWCVAHLGGADHRVLGELYEHLKMIKEDKQ